jgi:YtkA-like
MKKRSFALAAVAAVVVPLAGCSGASSEPSIVTVTSDSGTLRVELRMSQPVVQGVDSAVVTVTSAGDGGSIDGLTLAVTPWMPAMNHGTSVAPTAGALGGGRYQISNLVLFMEGHWEIRLAISGALVDHAAPAIDVP